MYVLDWTIFLKVLIGISVVLSSGILIKLIFYVKFCWILSSSYPGPKTHWLYGSLDKRTSLKKRMLWEEEMMVKFKGIYTLWIGPFFPVLAINNPEIARPIFLDNAHNIFLDIPKGLTLYKVLRPWLGDGLLLSEGAKWKRNRKLITPAFHFGVLKTYINVFNECIDTAMDQWADGKGMSQPIHNIVSKCTLDIMLQCAFGYKSAIQTGNSKYTDAILRLTILCVRRTFNPIYMFDCIYFRLPVGREYMRLASYIQNFSKEIILKRKEELETTDYTLDETKRVNFIDVLLTSKDEDGNGLDMRNIMDEANTFLFEGHDTTATSLCWVLYELAQNETWQNACREEALALPDYIEWDDLNSLVNIKLSLLESMRLHATVPLIGRRLVKPTEINGKMAPAGTTIILMLRSMYLHPDYWSNPKEFDPDRHRNIKKKDQYHFSYTPFSAGRRNCIGQNFAMIEMKIFLAKLLVKYTLTLDYEHPVQETMQLVLKSRNDIKLYFNPR